MELIKRTRAGYGLFKCMCGKEEEKLLALGNRWLTCGCVVHTHKKGSKYLTKIKELEPVFTPKGRKKLVSLFRCVCGNEVIKRHDNVKDDTDCGCTIRAEREKHKKKRDEEKQRLKELKKKEPRKRRGIRTVSQKKVIKDNSDNIKKHKLYYVWENIKRRCYSKNHHKYHIYGAKGVVMCDEWKNDYYAFYDWSMANGYQDGLSIDKDILSHELGIYPPAYSPNTCMFITISENVKARRTAKAKE